jgi:hypothetical protein
MDTHSPGDAKPVALSSWRLKGAALRPVSEPEGPRVAASSVTVPSQMTNFFAQVVKSSEQPRQ